MCWTRRPGAEPIDALAVARAALREPGLPTARHDEASRELKLLVDRRKDLLGQRTATVKRRYPHSVRLGSILVPSGRANLFSRNRWSNHEYDLPRRADASQAE
jgi:transposase